ncbi:MAG: class I tRNA ligase family protein [Terriglobia bacterium]
MAQWAKDNLYGQIRTARQGGPIFILHDGPLYSNGRIHLGTGLKNPIQKMG